MGRREAYEGKSLQRPEIADLARSKELFLEFAAVNTVPSTPFSCIGEWPE